MSVGGGVGVADTVLGGCGGGGVVLRQRNVMAQNSDNTSQLPMDADLRASKRQCARALAGKVGRRGVGLV